MRIYKKLSNVVHKWNNNKDIVFKEDELKAGLEVSIETTEILWKFLFICLWSNIKKYRWEYYSKEEDIPQNYAKPIRWLIVK